MNAQKPKENGKELLERSLNAASNSAKASIAIKGISATSLSDIEFNKGIAIKGDELFTGVVEYVNKDGDRFLIEYHDGVLVKSMKNVNPKTHRGNIRKDNFIKEYVRTEDGLEIKKIIATEDGMKTSN